MRPVRPVKKRLLDQVREKIRLKHYSLKTERSYVGWIKRQKGKVVSPLDLSA